MNSKSRLLPVTATVLWGAAFTLTPIAMKSFAPIDLMALRFGTAAIVYAILHVSGLVRIEKISAQDRPRFAGMVFAMICYNVCLNSAVSKGVPACMLVLIGQITPMLIIAIEKATTGKFGVSRPRVVFTVWLVGLLLVAQHYGGALAANSRIGILLAAMTPVSMATYMCLSKPLLARYEPTGLCARMFIACGLLLAVTRCFDSRFWNRCWGASNDALMAITALVLLSTVLAYAIWFAHMKAIGGPARCSVYLNLVPIFGVAMASAVLREAVSYQLLVGGTILVLGCIMNSPSASGRSPESQHNSKIM